MRPLTKLCALFAVVILMLGSACKSSEKALYSGDYETAISKSIKKIQNKKNNEKHILILESAFNKANASNLNRINLLKREGSPHNWMEIYRLYQNIYHRQERIRPLLPLRLASKNRPANLQLQNINQELADAKNGAADYLYTSATTLLRTGQKKHIRLAYDKFREVQNLFPNYRDTQKQLAYAKERGTNYALIQLVNNTGWVLPPGFERAVLQINSRQLNEKWVTYEVTSNNSNQNNYDFDIVVNVTNIDVSPESVNEKEYRRRREVEDGWEYVRDGEGNIVRDSLGKAVKEDKILNLSCKALDGQQRKAARIAGTVDYFERQTRKMLGRYPMEAETVFEHRYINVLRGDKRALADDLQDFTNNRPLPFPSDRDLIASASEDVKNTVKQILRDHRRLLRQ